MNTRLCFVRMLPIVLVLTLGGWISALPKALAAPPRTPPKARMSPAVKKPDRKPLTPALQGKLRAAFQGLPMSFERNQGQADAHVKFLARGQGYTLFLTPTEAVMALTKPSAAVDPLRIHTTLRQAATRQPQKRTPSKPRGAVLRMRLVGSNSGAVLQGQQQMQAKANYFTGQNPAQWRTNVALYSQVRCKEVYPGVDLLYYGNQERLEYDFALAPNADPRHIRLAFEGADSIRVTAQGDLALKCGEEEIIQRAPRLYQQNNGKTRLISGHYALRGKKTVGFDVGAFDRKKPLTIDPVLVFSTFLGGESQNAALAVAVDTQGCIYVTGYTNSTNFPTQNALQNYGGNSDAFVTKIDPSQTDSLVFSTWLGGSQNDQANAIAVDAAGNVYVAGYSSSSNFPTTSNAYLGASQNVLAWPFVTKIAPTGSTLLYSSFIANPNTEELGVASGLCADNNGNAYVTGLTTDSAFPTAGNTLPPAASPAEFSSFVSIIDTNAQGASSLTYSTLLGGSVDGSGQQAWTEGGGIAIDTAGYVYTTGDTGCVDFPVTSAAFQTVSPGGWSAYISKINPNAATGTSSLVYSTYLGGSATNFAYGIAVDNAGCAYVTGDTDSPDFPTTNNALQPTLNGFGDCFVSVINTAPGTGSPALVYSTFLSGSSGAEGAAIATDGAGKVFIAGQTISADFPTTEYAIQPYIEEQYEQGAGFVTVLDITQSGYNSLVYSTYLGGSTSGSCAGIAIDANDNCYVVGSTNSLDFPTTANAVDTAFSGSLSDGFVVKINPFAQDNLTSLQYGSYLGGADSNLGVDIAVDTQGNAYITGQTFAANWTNWPSVGYQQGINGVYNAFVAQLVPGANGYSYGYATYLGGSVQDAGMGIALDAQDDAYVTGFTYSLDFPTTSGALQAAMPGGQLGTEAAFASVLDPTGSQLLYSTYLGGSVAAQTGSSPVTQAMGIAVYNDPYDSNHELAYVGGFTNTTQVDFPVTPPTAFQNQYGGGASDVFVAKLDAHLDSQMFSWPYISYFGGSGDDTNGYVAVDNSGYVYLSGTTNSTDLPGANQTTRTSLNGGNNTVYDDAFVAEIDTTQCGANGLVFSEYLGGSGEDQGYQIAVDTSGFIYVTGLTASSDFPLGALGSNYDHLVGTQDAFVSCLTTYSGALFSTVLLGGSHVPNSESSSPAASMGLGIAVDDSMNAYVTGETNTTDFPTRPTGLNSAQVLQRQLSGKANAFITQVSFASYSGTITYSTYLGGSDRDYGYGIFAQSGLVYVVGLTTSPDFPTSTNAIQTQFGGAGGDIFVAIVNMNGSNSGSDTITLSATPGNGQITLNWNSVTGAENYTLYRSTNPQAGDNPSNYQIVQSGLSAISYVDAPLANGTTYYYLVQAFNGSTQPVSNVALATPSNGVTAAQGLKIDSGGPAVLDWVADVDYTGGSTYSVTNAIDTTGVVNPAPQEVYQTERNGNFTYVIPGLIPFATYKLRLHFSENLFPTTSGGPAVGQRIFNVTVNNAQFLTNFDIYQTAGAQYKAVVEEANAVADAFGDITLAFITVVNQAKVDGIEVLHWNAPLPQTPLYLAASPGNNSVLLRWNAINGATYNLYRATASGAEGNTPLVTNVPVQIQGDGTLSYTDTGLTNGTTYYYQVAAVQNGLLSARSNEASATPGVSVVLFADNFTTSAPSANLNFEVNLNVNNGGRQSGTAAPLTYLTAPANTNNLDYTQVNDGLLFLTPNGASSTPVTWATPYHSFMESGNLNIDFDVTFSSQSTAQSANAWVGVRMGDLPGGLLNGTENGFGVQLNANGQYEAFLTWLPFFGWNVSNAPIPGAYSLSSNGTNHVHLQLRAAGFAGGPFTLSLDINGAHEMDYVLPTGYIYNYLTLQNPITNSDTGDNLATIGNLTVTEVPGSY